MGPLQHVADRVGMSAPDLTYSRSCGLFWMFFAETGAGAEAWAKIAAQTDGTGKVMAAHLGSTLRQLRAAGYVVARAAKPAADTMSDDELMAALGGLTP